MCFLCGFRCPGAGVYLVQLAPPPTYTPYAQYNITLSGQLYLLFQQPFLPAYQVPAYQAPRPQPIYQTPPTVPSGHPMPIPANIPKSIRYEYINGKIQPVTHYHSPTYANPTPTPEQQRGYNIYHGYDTGPLPPGFGSVGLVENWDTMEPTVVTSPEEGVGSGWNAGGQVIAENSVAVQVGENRANGSSGENVGGTGAAGSALAEGAVGDSERGLPVSPACREEDAEGRGEEGAQGRNEGTGAGAEEASSVAAVGFWPVAQRNSRQFAVNGEQVADGAEKEAATAVAKEAETQQGPQTDQDGRVTFHLVGYRGD